MSIFQESIATRCPCHRWLRPRAAHGRLALLIGTLKLPSVPAVAVAKVPFEHLMPMAALAIAVRLSALPVIVIDHAAGGGVVESSSSPPPHAVTAAVAIRAKAQVLVFFIAIPSRFEGVLALRLSHCALTPATHRMLTSRRSDASPRQWTA